METPLPAADQVLRVITNDGAFRVIAARTTHTARGVAVAQGASGVAAIRLAELVTGAVLLRETMAPTLRLQCILDLGDGGRMVADAHPDGGSRALLTGASEPFPLEIAPGALLRVSRAMPNGTLHEGVVAVGGIGGISEAIMAYLQESEQVVAVLAVAALPGTPHLEQAGGYLVQLLPEAGRDLLAVMSERLADLAEGPPWLDEGYSPERIVATILDGVPFTRLDENALAFRCRCSRERVLAAMATLSAADLAAAQADGKPLEVRCDYCGVSYAVDPDSLPRPAAPAPHN